MFGLKNAPAIPQRIIDDILRSVQEKSVLLYIIAYIESASSILATTR